MNEPTCNRCNTPLATGQTKFCSHSCANSHNMKVAAERNLTKARKLCEVEGCAKHARSMTATMCPMHYHRVYRYGSTQPVHPPKWIDIRGQRFGTLTVVSRAGQTWNCSCDCGENRSVSAGELNRSGSTNTCGKPGSHLSDAAGYGAVHERVRRAHGPASALKCVDCGRGAQHWSYNHADPSPLYADGLSVQPIPYSLDMNCYEPRCVQCHKIFDVSRGQL